MAMRPCLDCGRPSDGTRCPTHARAKDRARGTTTERGYGADHQGDRAAWAPLVASGGVSCRRCDQPIDPTEAWHLGHPDAESSAPKAPEHAGRCNIAAANRLRSR